MAFSLTVHASLVACCLRAPGLHHQSEAARLLATDRFATALALGTNPRLTAETQILFQSAGFPQQPLVVPPPDPNDTVMSIGGPCYGKYFWFRRDLRVEGNFGPFVPPVGGTDEPSATAEEVWAARVNQAPSDATALIAAASGTFDLAGTRDDLIAFDALNPATDTVAWLALYEELFG